MHDKWIFKEYSNITISTQVMNELSNVCLKKYHLKIEHVEDYLRELSNIVEIHILDAQTSFSALNLLKKYKFSFYDALIVASALEENCETLFSEDMQHDQIIEDKLLIQNPFYK